MTIHRTIIAAAFALTAIGAAQADGLRPIEGRSIDLGDVSGIAYYTVEPDGFRVVATLAQGEAGHARPFRGRARPGPERRALHPARSRCRSQRGRDQPARRPVAGPRGSSYELSPAALRPPAPAPA